MSAAVVVAPGKAPQMGLFERYLTLWVALCIIVGIGLGQLLPGVFTPSARRRSPTSTFRLPCWSG